MNQRRNSNQQQQQPTSKRQQLSAQEEQEDEAQLISYLSVNDFDYVQQKDLIIQGIKNQIDNSNMTTISIERQDQSNIQYQVDKSDKKFADFLKKLRKLKSVYESNIINISEYISSRENNFIFIQVQKYALTTITDSLRDYKYTLSELFKLFYQVLKGYVCIYKLKIVHGWIRPECIFMANQFQVKLGGMEMSSVQQYELGPPEWDTHVKPTYQSDIYQLGQLLHYILLRQFAVDCRANPRPFLQIAGLTEPQVVADLVNQSICAAPEKRLNLTQFVQVFQKIYSQQKVTDQKKDAPLQQPHIHPANNQEAQQMLRPETIDDDYSVSSSTYRQVGKNLDTIGTRTLFEEDVLLDQFQIQSCFGPKFMSTVQLPKEPDEDIEDELQADLMKFIADGQHFLERVMSLDYLITRLQELKVDDRDILILKFIIPRIQLLEIIRQRDLILVQTSTRNDISNTQKSMKRMKKQMLDQFEKIILNKYKELQKTVQDDVYE